MTAEPHGPDADGGGFDVDDWRRLSAFGGAVAGLDDVQAGRAVFALADTEDPRPLAMELPQPVIWWDDDGEQAAVAVQAEAHTSPDGELMEVLGLILPDGGSAVALLEDVDLVDDTDELVPECVADPGVRHQTVVEVQVGPADGGELHPDYRVVRVFDRRHRFLLDADFVGTSVRHRFHADRDTRAGRAETAPGEHVESGDRSAANVWDRDHRQAAGSRRA